MIKGILTAVSAILVTAAAGFIASYFPRLRTAASVKKLTDLKDGFDLYRVDISYPYDPDRLVAHGPMNDRTVADSIIREAFPLLPVRMDIPKYGCSAFGIKDSGGSVLMGRNYDFTNDTSALLVFCAPENGYRSVATTALDHVGKNRLRSLVDGLFALPAPFICLDGMNERGVSIAVLNRIPSRRCRTLKNRSSSQRSPSG